MARQRVDAEGEPGRAAVRLMHRDPSEREAAEAVLRAAGAEGVAAVGRIAVREVRRGGARRAGLSRVAAVSLTAYGVFYVAYGVMHVRLGLWPQLSPAAIAALYAGLLPSLALGVRSLTEGRRERLAIAYLASCGDTAAVRPLLDVYALCAAREQCRSAAASGLIRLLPHLSDTEARSLSAAQSDVLSHIVDLPAGWLMRASKREIDLVVAALGALALIGDARALDRVERLAGDREVALQGTRIREAAEQCLPRLRARVEQARMSGTLVRSADGASAALLPRPAPPTAAPDETLLRAQQETE